MLDVRVKHWNHTKPQSGTDPTAGNSVVPGYLQHIQSVPVVEEWTCWVYTNDKESFLKWFEKNCPTGSCIFRFNSGNPMFTVLISDMAEATLFKLMWITD